MRQIPMCPKCGQHHTLKLSDDMVIRCYKTSGGCGAEFTLDELPSLYRDEPEPIPPKTRNPRKVRKP